MKNLEESAEHARSLLAKIEEQTELVLRLIQLIPADKLEWRPIESSFRMDELLGHLLESFAGFCAALYAVRPEELKHFLQLRDLPVNHPCGIEEALQRIQQYLQCIQDGFALLSDSDMSVKIPTVFKANGENVITILLGNFEHVVNHKHQLFFYLKLLGLPVTSKDLYRFRN